MPPLRAMTRACSAVERPAANRTISDARPEAFVSLVPLPVLVVAGVEASAAAARTFVGAKRPAAVGAGVPFEPRTPERALAALVSVPVVRVMTCIADPARATEPARP